MIIILNKILDRNNAKSHENILPDIIILKINLKIL